MLVMFYCQLGILVTSHDPLRENMMPSTKPEVHNVMYCSTARGGLSHNHTEHAQKKIEVWPCGFPVVQADRQTQYSALYLSQEQAK